MSKVDGDGEFTFYVNGTPIEVKYDPAKRLFFPISKTNEEVSGLPPRPIPKQKMPNWFGIGPYGISTSYDWGSTKILVGSRQEAIKLFSFLKSVNIIDDKGYLTNSVRRRGDKDPKITVNDLYSVDAVPIAKNIEPEPEVINNSETPRKGFIQSAKDWFNS